MPFFVETSPMIRGSAHLPVDARLEQLLVVPRLAAHGTVTAVLAGPLSATATAHTLHQHHATQGTRDLLRLSERRVADDVRAQHRAGVPHDYVRASTCRVPLERHDIAFVFGR
jgi:hypothetical protein